MSTTTKPPVKIHGLNVLTYHQAKEQGFESITTGVSANTENHILASMARHRDPRRAVWIHNYGYVYELAIHRAEICR